MRTMHICYMYWKMVKPLIMGKAAAEDVGVKAIDEDTLVVTLENPTAYFLKLLASHSYYPVSKKQ